MKYTIPIIKDIHEIHRCPPLMIRCFSWRCVCQPESYGQMAVLENSALVIRLVCRESNPYKTYTEHFSPVYRDSALEAFLEFDPASGIYMNFEFNANGAALAMFGKNRNNRFRFNSQQIESLNIKAEQTSEEWSISFILPLQTICEIIPGVSLENGHSFKFNFYKICETPEMEHYASLEPIYSDKPDFHRPCDFADALISGVDH